MGDDDDNASSDDLGADARAFLAMLSQRSAQDGAAASVTPMEEVIAPAPMPTAADLADIRTRLGLSDVNTLAAAGTNIPAIADKSFVGLSPALRREAGLPSLDELYGADRDIKSPNRNALASRHAEEDILNGFDTEITAANLSDDDLEGREISMHISNATGICVTCIGGLGTSKGMDGVIKQFSLKYPTLTIRITAEGGNAYKDRAVVLVRGGDFVDS